MVAARSAHLSKDDFRRVMESLSADHADTATDDRFDVIDFSEDDEEAD